LIRIRASSINMQLPVYRREARHRQQLQVARGAGQFFCDENHL
jgi:hypothetical protein